MVRFFKGKRFEIVALTNSYAITCDNNGRFTLSNNVVRGLDTATIRAMRDNLKCRIDDAGKVDAVKINNAFFFPHISICAKIGG